MKKTKFLALASLILAAGLVGCGGGEAGSEKESVEETSQSEVVSTPSEETSSEDVTTSSEVVTPSSEDVTPSEETSESTGGTTGTYSSTPALALAITSEYPSCTVLNVGTYTLGDFEWDIKEDGKGEINDENKEVLVNGATKSYTQRLNSKSSKNNFYFTTTQASKLIVVARSSSKDATATRTVNVSDSTGTVVGTSTLPGGTGDKNASYEAYEFVLNGSGDFTINISGGASHILDFLVYYAA